MGLLSVLILLAVSVACANADTYGDDKKGTTQLVRRDGQVTNEKPTKVSFNKNSKYHLTIDKVIVNFKGTSIRSKKTEGGPRKSFVTLELTTTEAKAEVTVAIYGRMKRGYRKSEIKAADVIFI